MRIVRDAFIGVATGIATLLAGVASVVVLVVGFQWVRLANDAWPDGPTCSYEDDPGSGSSGTGLEHIDWGLMPERICVAESGRVYQGRELSDQATRTGLIELALLPVVLVGGGVVAGRRTNRAFHSRFAACGRSPRPS